MEWQAKLKESWKDCSKMEMAGWLFFTGIFSLLVITQTVLWDMGSDKVETGYLGYRLIMTAFFTGLSGIGMYLGYHAIKDGWHPVEENEFWRAFSGGVFFALLQVTFTFIELLVMPLRGVQVYEYLQGLFYLGTATGCGMVWYLYLVSYRRKKNRVYEQENL